GDGPEGGVSLGQRIREARRRRGMTLRDLAGGTLSVSLISMVEHDRVRPSLKTLRVLARRLGVPVRALLDDDPAEAVELQVRLGEGLLRQHRFAEARDVLARIPERSLESAALRARRALGVGQAYAGLRRFREAARHLRKAATLAEALGDVDLMAAAANALGFAALRARRFALAREILQGAVDTLRRSGHTRTDVYGKLLANLGRAYLELGLPVQAEEFFRQAADVLDPAADPYHLGLLYFNLGIACERQQNFEQARDYLDRAAHLFTLHENVRLLGAVRRSVGMLLLEQGHLERARAALEDSLRLARQSGDDEGVAQTLVELARLHARAGEPEAARRSAAEARDLAARMDDPAEQARALAAEADALAAQGQVEEAVRRYQEAAEAFARLQMDGEYRRICRDLGFVLMRDGRREQAAEWFARAFQGPAPAARERREAR
ncbi:MAG: tetratricopeptide repeat protein, partial [Armatimonadota bacterium]|nr:tetratricopeptide repeat protein [Armatimonadota bacterium]MDR7437639.1 tetratricopeptide repeat protein [Armatimonadota bacterium]